MAGDRQGRCVNVGNCSLADKRELITTKPGQDFVCPECGKGLILATAATAPRRSNVAARAGIGIILALVAGGLALRNCRGRSEPLPGVSPVGDAEPTLRLGGSNTIGAKLAPSLVTAYFKDLGCPDVTTTTPATDETKLTCTTNGRSLVATVAAHGSATAFEGLASKSLDIGMASRKIKADEVDKLRSLGDMTAPSNEHVLGLDGIAVIVHPANRVASLTVDQVGAIFSGVITDWKQVGGTPGPIDVYARDDKSGTYDTFKTLVLGKTALASGAKRYEASDELASKVTNDPNGIGFVGLSSVAGAKAVPVSAAGATPLVPNRFTVATEDYTLSRRLFLYTPTSNANPDVARFVTFATSSKGQAVVEQAGFVPLTIREEHSAAPTGAPAAYSSLVTNALRLSVDFRFRTASSELDNRGLKDLDRVTEFLASSTVHPDRLMLLGFADSRGSNDRNQVLSEARARAVATALSERGVTPGTIRGFGSALPVADNATPDGQEKNRRVEVWVKR